MSRRPASLLERIRHFPGAREGVAAVEFALILPFMLLLYIGSIELSDLIAVDRRVTIIAGTVGDLVARADGSLEEDELTDYFNAAEAIIRPYDDAQLRQVVTSVYVDEDGVAEVVWSRGFNDGVPHEVAEAIEVPVEITSISLDGYVIVSETMYAYRPLLGLVFTEEFNLYRENFHLPRFGQAITIEE
jgi:Flp pilus assembly protein TadG